MPTIAEFRGIKVCIYWQDHMPPHFHAFYGDEEVLVAIESLEILQGHFPAKQRKYLRKIPFSNSLAYGKTLLVYM